MHLSEYLLASDVLILRRSYRHISTQIYTQAHTHTKKGREKKRQTGGREKERERGQKHFVKEF